MKYQQTEAYQKFVNEILDDVVMESEKIVDYVFFEKTGQFTFETVNQKIDFYPHSDKIHFRKKKKWQTNGLKILLDFIGAETTCITCPHCNNQIRI